MLRARANSMAIVCSAAVLVLPSGVFMTTTPAVVAVATSILSTPMPARPMTRSRLALARISAVTLVRLRTIKPSYSPIHAFSSSADSSGR